MQVYEFVGYLNTPDQCNGQWYQWYDDEEFPYPLDGSRIKPRTTYYDNARDCRMSENFQMFLMATDHLIIRKEWCGKWLEGADKIVTCPIQHVTFSRFIIPQIIYAKGSIFPLATNGLEKLIVTVPHIEFVSEFVTASNEVVKTTYIR